MRWTPFTNLYREFSELIEYINEHKQELQKASLAYSKVTNEKQLLEWLLEYESLYENAPFDYKYAIYVAVKVYKWQGKPSAFQRWYF